MEQNITGKAQPRFPITSEDEQSGSWVNADGFVRYMFARDAKFNSLQFKPEDFAQRIREISEMFDTTDPDLSAFLNRGGKLILKGNGADYQRSLLQEIDLLQVRRGEDGTGARGFVHPLLRDARRQSRR